MIRYECDWCGKEQPRNEVSTVTVSNLYSDAVTCHICRGCGRSNMPELLQPMLSWAGK